MAVEKIDVQIQGMISGAQQKAQAGANLIDEADAARRRAQKKIEEKKQALKSGSVHKESFQRTNKLKSKMRQVLGGSQGPESAEAAKAWGDNNKLQSKLSESAKSQMRELWSQNPAKATKASKAMNRLSQSPEFDTVDTKKQGSMIQQTLMEAPELEKPASELLKNKYLQSSKNSKTTDPETKNRFMDFGLRQMKKGGTEMKLGSVKHAGDMLANMTDNGTTKGAQRAAMKMVETKPNDLGAMKNVDAFVQEPAVKSMPNFARGKATELLAKAGGEPEVQESFTQLAKDPKFKAQTAENKGRFFSTVGTGRASEFRAISDNLLKSMRGTDFPERSNQVSKFLNTMSKQVSSEGAKGLNSKSAITRAKSSGLPKPPSMIPTEGLSEEDALAARSQNRANVIQFYNKLSRSYEKAEKKLNSAKYLEDVNSLQQLREPPSVDTSSLTPEELAFVEERGESVKKKLGQVKKLQRQKARELRGKRMPPAKRRALAAKRRIKGKQPKYFSPNAGRSRQSAVMQKAVGAEQVMPEQPQSTQAKTPSQQMRGTRHAQMRGKGQMGGADIQSQVASALAQMGQGPMTAEIAGQVAQTIATQVAAQVAAQVAEQLLGGTAKGKAAGLGQSQEPKLETHKSEQMGKTDGWGIPRSFERDLGGARRTAVRPKIQQPEDDGEYGDAPTLEQVLNEKYTGKLLVKDPSVIRSLLQLFQCNWKGLNRSEAALLKNLGWNQQGWDTKDTPSARWPMAMATPFVNLNSTQREAVRKLGFSPHDWDTRVQAFSMGKNA